MTFFTTARMAKNPTPAMQPGPCDFTQGSQLALESASATISFSLGSFGLVRTFLEHLVVDNAEGTLGGEGAAPHEIDWAAVEASTSDCGTLEQAIGRAVVVADQMSRGVFEAIPCADLWASYDANDPFFAFSVADVAPDFGDDSRYRKRVARKVAGILGTRRNLVAT
jgi:hypothetical protein